MRTFLKKKVHWLINIGIYRSKDQYNLKAEIIEKKIKIKLIIVTFGINY